MYWSDYSAGTISTVSYNGGATNTLMSGLVEPAGLDLELSTGRLYIVQKGLASLGWTTPAGVGFTTVFSPPPIGEMWDVAVIIVPEPATGVALLTAAGILLLRRRLNRGSERGQNVLRRK